MDAKTVRKLKKELHKATVDDICRLGLKKRPLLPSHQTGEMMRKRRRPCMKGRYRITSGRGDRLTVRSLDLRYCGRVYSVVAEGSTDYQAIGKALHEVGFQGLAVIELAHERNFKPTRPIRESLKISREFVRKVLGY